MSDVLRLRPDDWYSEEALRMLGLDGDVLRRAKTDGHLRFRQLGRGKVLYKGAWLIEWLERPEGSVK